MKYQVHSRESYDAAISMMDSAENLRGRVFRFIRSMPEGATDEQIQHGLDMNPSTQRPRRVELAEMGVICSEGKRETASGRSAAVWKVARRPSPDGRLF